MFRGRKSKKNSSKDDKKKGEESEQPKTPTTRYRLRTITPRRGSRTQSSVSDSEDVNHNARSNTTGFDQIRVSQIQKRNYSRENSGGGEQEQRTRSSNSLDRRSVNSMNNSHRLDTLSTSGVYQPNAIQRSRSVNTADYFTIFSYGNNNSSQSFNESFSQPNSWSQTLDNSASVRNRQRQRLDSGDSDVNPMDGHSFSRVSRGITPSPRGSRESVRSQDSQGVRRNYGYIAAFKDVNKVEGAASPTSRGSRDTSPSSIGSRESLGGNSRRNFGYMAAFKVSLQTPISAFNFSRTRSQIMYYHHSYIYIAL